MGVIQRQSIKQSLVSYLGVLIGMVSMFFIYPLEREAYGLARFIMDTAQIIFPIILLGSSAVSIKFFPQVQELGHLKKSYLSSLFVFFLVGATIFTALFVFFGDNLINLYVQKENYSQLLVYFPYVYPAAILLAIMALLYSYIVNFKRIVVPAIFQQLLIKITLPILILLVISSYFNYHQMIIGILITYILAIIGLIGYLIYLGRLDIRPNLGLFKKMDKGTVLKYSFYSMFAAIGSVLAFRIDSWMISTLIDFDSNGIYGICLIIGSVIAIPTNAINQISGPMISEALHANEISKIEAWYKNASFNLLLVGLIIFVLMLLSIKDLFLLMPNFGDVVDQGFWIVILIALAKIVDMGCSINNQIIGYSKYYKFGFYAILMLAIVNIVLNYFLIPQYQIIGAALATLIAISLNNLIKFGFILNKYKIQPFTMKTIYLILIVSFCYGIGYLIPDLGSHILNIVVKSSLVLMAYLLIVYKSKMSLELNTVINNYFLKK